MHIFILICYLEFYTRGQGTLMNYYCDQKVMKFNNVWLSYSGFPFCYYYTVSKIHDYIMANKDP